MTVFWGLVGLLGLLGCVGLLRSRAVPTEADPLARYPEAREPARPNADTAHTPLMTPVVTPDMLGSEQPLNQVRAQPPGEPRPRVQAQGEPQSEPRPVTETQLPAQVRTEPQQQVRAEPESSPRRQVRAQPPVQAEPPAVPDVPRQPRHAPAAAPVPARSAAAPAPAHAAEPRPVAQQAVEPQPAESQPVTQQSVEQRAVEPQPVESQSVESRPEPSAPESGTITGEIPAPRGQSAAETPEKPASGRTTVGRKAVRGLLNRARRVLNRH